MDNKKIIDKIILLELNYINRLNKVELIKYTDGYICEYNELKKDDIKNIYINFIYDIYKEKNIIELKKILSYFQKKGIKKK